LLGCVKRGLALTTHQYPDILFFSRSLCTGTFNSPFKLKNAVKFPKYFSLFQKAFLILSSTVADPGSGAFLILDLRSGMGKKSRSGSGMNLLDHISESSETIFWVKNT
jgi:hypothetical protein